MKKSQRFQNFCLFLGVVIFIFYLAGCGSVKNQTQPSGYPIDSDVQTTLQRTIVPGTISAGLISLSAIASYDSYGYGSWTFGSGLASDKRLDIMPAGYSGSSTTNQRLLNFFSISDIHITDKESPNQMIYLQSLWPTLSFGMSIYSGVMLYSTQVLDAAVQTINALHQQKPFDFGISLGDTCNTTQYNETRWYLDVLDGKVINPSSGAHLGSDTIDYQKPFKAAGLNRDIPWYQTLGNHDHFWMGSFPVDYSLRDDLRESYVTDEVFATANLFLDFSKINERLYYMGVLDGSTPNGDIIDTGPVGNFSSVPKVVADPDRRSLKRDEWMKEFFNTTSNPVGHGFNLTDANNGFACYSFVPKSNIPIKVIVLDDTQKEDDNSTDVHGHGFLDATRWSWLKQQLADGDSANQLMIIAAHVPISVEVTAANSELGWWTDSQNAVTLPDLVAELQSHPNLIMWMSGHRHYSTVKAFVSPDPVNHPEYGFWEVETPSLRDFPQEFRTFEIDLNQDYSISIVATDVDPAVKPGSLAATSRKYAIAAMQIVGTWTQLTSSNPSHDPTVKPMPTASYNAELLKQLSPAMILRMQTLFPAH